MEQIEMFAYGYPIVSAAFVEETTLSPLNCLYTFFFFKSIDQCVWINF